MLRWLGFGKEKKQPLLTAENRVRLFAKHQQAQTAIQHKQWEEALNLEREVLSLRPDWPDGLFLVGQCLYGLKRYQEAQELLEPMVSAAPQDGELQQLWAMIAEDLEQWNLARQGWAKALYADPTNTSRAQRLRKCAMKENNPSAAAEVLEELGHELKDMSMLQIASELYFKAGEKELAEQLAEEAMAAPLLQPISISPVTEEDPPEEEESLTEDERDQNSLSSLLKVEYEEEETVSVSEVTFSESQAHDDAQKDSLEGDDNKSQAHASIEDQPLDINLSRTSQPPDLGITTEELDTLADILDAAETSASAPTEVPLPSEEQASDEDDDWFNRATAFLEQGDAEQALACLQSHLAKDPEDITALRFFALTQTQNGQHAEALKSYEALLQHCTDNPGVLLQAGEAAFEAGQPQQAFDFLQQALKLDPHYVEAWARFGMVADYMGKFDQAYESYETAFRFGWQQEETLVRWAQIMESRNEIQQAKEIYTKLLEQNHQCYEALLGMAKSAFAEDAYEVAVGYLEQCQESVAEDLNVMRLLAQSYHRMERWEDAAGLWALLVNYAPEDTMAREHLAQAQAQSSSSVNDK